MKYIVCVVIGAVVGVVFYPKLHVNKVEAEADKAYSKAMEMYRDTEKKYKAIDKAEAEADKSYREAMEMYRGTADKASK